MRHRNGNVIVGSPSVAGAARALTSTQEETWTRRGFASSSSRSHISPPKKLNSLRFSPPRALPRPARFRPYKYPGSPFAPSSKSPRCQFLRDPPQSSPFISLRSGGTMASVGSLSASPLLALTFVEQSVQGRSGSTNYSQGQRCLNRERDAVLRVCLSCDTVLRVFFTDRTASLKHFPTESYQPTSRLTSP